MQPVRFFYSTDGTDVRGPITMDALRLLFQNGVIGPGSHICREGENEWRELSPVDFQSGATTRLKPYEPPPYKPGVETLERMKDPPDPMEESSSASPILNWISAAVGIVIAVIVVVVLAKQSKIDQGLSYEIGGVIGGFLFVWGVPALISMIFKGHTRYLVRLIGVALFSLLSFLIVEFLSGKASPPRDVTASTQENAKPVPAEANSVANSPPATPPPPSPEVKASSSLNEKAAHDLATVTSQFTAIVTASNEAESACNVDVNTIESTEDIAARRDALMKLRAAQLEVIVYLQNFESHCREALAFDNFPTDFINNLIANEHKNGKVDPLIALWQAKMKLSDDHIARLDYLAKAYGAWNVKDGKVVFTDADASTAYNNLLKALQKDIDVIGDDQKKINQ